MNPGEYYERKRKRAAQLVGELREIDAAISEAQKASDACPHCYDCWCDGDWSPQAELLRLYDRRVAASAALEAARYVGD